MMKIVSRASIVAIALTWAALWAQPAQAMPIFAKAYGVKCSLCHTVVPALNSYGRYVQRSGYSSLNYDVLKQVPPFWIGEQLNGDSTGGVSNNKPTNTNSLGNVAFHGAGYISPNWTFHLQQWILANDSTGGGLDTLWVTYNNLLHRDGHLFLGKYEAPAPSPFSQWFDLSAFANPEITVGEHAYQVDGNRWGAKLAYTPGALDAELGYMLSANDLPQSGDFSTNPGTDKTFQWKLASGHPDQPLEYGAYGSIGSFIVSTGASDHYTSLAGYVQRDPEKNGIPGILSIYQIANDSNPGVDGSGMQLPAAHSQALTAEIYEPVFNNGAMLAYREEFTNDGLGTPTHYGVVDFAFNVPQAPYIHGYLEAGLNANSAAPNGGPTWRWMLWWTAPIAK